MWLLGHVVPIVPEKFQKILGSSRKYFCKSIHLLSKDDAEQTADLLVDRLSCVPGEENIPEKAGGYCPAGQAMAKEFCYKNV